MTRASDQLVPPWLRRLRPELREAITRIIGTECARLLREEGPRAFELLRSVTCAHESGHAIVDTVLGARVKYINIHPGTNGACAGATCSRWRPGWWSALPPTRALQFRAYRLLAGAIGERVLDPANVRSGSALDERVGAQTIAYELHQHEGRAGHPSETWAEYQDWVAAAIKNNEAAGRLLMAKLDVTGRLKGKSLDAILQPVRRIPEVDHE